MGAVYTNWDIMFAFTCNGAGMTSNAHPIINDKTVIHLSFFKKYFTDYIS